MAQHLSLKRSLEECLDDFLEDATEEELVVAREQIDSTLHKRKKRKQTTAVHTAIDNLVVAYKSISRTLCNEESTEEEKEEAEKKLKTMEFEAVAELILQFGEDEESIEVTWITARLFSIEVARIIVDVKRYDIEIVDKGWISDTVEVLESMWAKLISRPFLPSQEVIEQTAKELDGILADDECDLTSIIKKEIPI